MHRPLKSGQIRTFNRWLRSLAAKTDMSELIDLYQDAMLKTDKSHGSVGIVLKGAYQHV